MDSDDHMHDDVNDVDSIADDYCSDDCDYNAYDYYADDSDRLHSRRPEQDFTILKESDILQSLEEDTTKLAAFLSISKFSASILLRHYNWSVSEVHDAWFADEDRVRQAVGLLEKPVVQHPNTRRKITCAICFEKYPCAETAMASCGHPFCLSCWERYITTSINDGPGCLMLRCPDPSCGAAVGQDMVDQLASDEDKHKYRRYLIRSYIEDSKKSKWCPAPDCEYAVTFDAGGGNYDVSCLCSYCFCWNCTEEAHRPVDCDTVAKWILKNSSESENTNWILAYTKPCPKCNRAIEKNQGCMHMTCRPPCLHQFCWICLGPWSEHRTYTCNRYETAKQGTVFNDSERKRERAKKSLERYTHYYERWASNQSSRQKALTDLHQMQTVHMEKLSSIRSTPVTQLKFITDAWLQIIECRRVLKWTYAYGYYSLEHEHAKRQLFEYLQGEAESGLERLHQCAEKELEPFLNADDDDDDDDDGLSKEFTNFRTKLTGLTSVTRNYFENLVTALENGLSDVNGEATSSKNAAGRSKGRSSKRSRKIDESDLSRVTYESERSRVINESDWFCQKCTFANRETSTECEMCNEER